MRHSGWNDKVAIITGGTSGIGRALAEELARRGSVVVLTGRNRDRGGAVAEAIQQAGGRATFARADVTDAKAVQEAVDDVVQGHGRLDYMFNNAGVGIMGEVRDMTLEDWDRIIDVNLRGVVHGVAAAYPVMVRQGSGHIVNTASLGGLVPLPMSAAYATTKYAVVGLSTSLREEAALLGVNVSVACPAVVQTHMFDAATWLKVDRARIMAAMPDKGISPEACARSIMRGVEKNHAIILDSRFAKGLRFVDRFLPVVSARILGVMTKRLAAARTE